MFFELSKIIPAFFYPLPLFFLFFYLWFIFGKMAKKPWKLFSFVTLLLVASTGLFNDILLGFWEPQLPVAPYPKAGAIVVLGGSTHVSPDSEMGVEGDFNHRVDRFLWGIRLFRAGHGRILLFSGGSGLLLEDSELPSEAAMQRRWAGTLGIAQGNILTETESRNTYENAVNSAILLRQRNISQILLITSAMHMPRSQALFEKQGLEVIPFPVDSSKRHMPFPLNLYPEPKNLQTFHDILKEWVGYISYGFLSYL